MKLFESYINDFESVFSKKTTITPKLLEEQRSYNDKIIKSLSSGGSLEDSHQIQGPKVLFKYDNSILLKYFGTNLQAFNSITIGAHPDFKNIGASQYENHYCVSAFVDIKGSTRLIGNYSLLEVRLIKDSLLTLAILIANQFGGHVHRLQGDGIFLQFVRRNSVYNDAIINALNATSILTLFVSISLAKIMEQNNLSPIKIRVGIDYGNKDDVLWSHYGIPGCSELTTTSLHTDMAAKLQAKAYENSIIIGGNIKDALDLKRDFCDIYENEESKEKVYQISSQFTYPFFVFNWKEYLLTLPFISKTSEGTLDFKEKKYSIDCYISNEDDSERERYYPNSKSIPKGKKIEFILMRDGSPLIKRDFEKIEWYAFNTGKEAEKSNELKHNFNKKYNNLTQCNSAAAYLGHHHVECKIIREHSDPEKVIFPIFVQ
jgi:adenylate cyclase